MAFSERLDLLMNLCGISNSVLARHMRLDPSYISRLRHGTRSLPPDSEYLPKLTCFLLRQCSGERQRRALCQAVEAPESAFSDLEGLEKIVCRWLCGDEREDPVGMLLSDLSSVAPAPKKQQVPLAGPGEVLAFYGDEGRRQSTIALFNCALQQPGPVTLLLFSDEDDAWMSKSSTFSYEWSTLLWQIILRGGRVKVIHKVSRNIDEMFEVIRRWLPFYVSGAIEPYYYPRLRDGIYKRTLSVIPGVAATFSTSIGQQTGVVTTFMTRERLAVDSFTNEFSSYVALCRPLIEFFTMSTLVETFQSYLACAAVTNILRSDGLSFTTLPDSVLQRISGMYDASMEATLNQIHNAWGKKFSDNASQCSTYHLLRLAPPEEVAAGRTPISCAGMLRGEPVCYRPEEYCAQLENILALMERYPWFQVCLDEGEREGYTLHIFEEQDVYLFKEEPPYIIFRIREPNTVAAFWDYMQRTVEDLRQERPAVCRRIREHMEQIRRAMEDRGIQFM